MMSETGGFQKLAADPMMSAMSPHYPFGGKP